ncbi:FGGY-family carbohydrate kinase [Mycetocola spongiae]|uniref:FGGY-family carbohydrate kinase n=1 Tax=Mycetocola spongiae TaxID=2859226 RepID=UPI001CF33CA8|nr:FGGY-family carbohydrate kinase [Mycetocola spongiae]UCR88860.1 FGGY-family carbohydrate kinase [Mycetocola spongiae]
MSGPLWLGIDLGTQSVKALVVDEAGEILAQAGHPLGGVREGVRHEQDPAEWIAACADIAARVCAALGARVHDLRALAICSTSGTIIPVDAAGRATGAAIMYDDARGAAHGPEVHAAEPALWARLGVRIQPSWALPSLMDLLRRGLPAGTARIAHQGDVIGAALAGHAVPTDWTSALKTGYNTQDLCWPEAVLERLGVPPELLPKVVAPGTVLGETSAAWCERTGMPAGIPILAGTTDGCAAQFGAGALGLGDRHSVIGTTLVIKGVSPAPVADDSGVVYSHRSPEPGAWFPGGASSAGAGALSLALPGRDLDALGSGLEATLAPGGPAAALPVAYPLVGRGERFPLALPRASGFLRSEGSTTPLPATGPGSGGDTTVFAGILGGVACVERLAYDRLNALGAGLTGRLTSSGGGTRSPLWNRLRATMLDTPVSIPASTEGALGMAILAAWSATGGGHSLADTARRLGRISRIIDPDPALRPRTEDLYARFRATLAELDWIHP